MRALLIDLDGTLTDPKPGIVNCIRHALETLGVDAPPADELTWCIGPPLRESFRILVGEDGADHALALYRERFAAVGMYENAVYPGIVALLEKEAGRGRRLHLATTKPHVYARPILAHFGLDAYFAGVYGSELDGTRADKRELLRHLAAEEGIAPGTAAMIGDRRFDMEAAREIGAVAIWADWGYGDAAERVAARPDHVCATPADLAALLAGL